VQGEELHGLAQDSAHEMLRNALETTAPFAEMTYHVYEDAHGYRDHALAIWPRKCAPSGRARYSTSAFSQGSAVENWHRLYSKSFDRMLE
jgi:hypothetical protein